MSVIKTTSLFKHELPQRCACGGKPEMYITTSEDYEGYIICCPSCGRQTQTHRSEAEARKEWNGCHDR